MKPIQLICQNCNLQYNKMKDFKAHVRSYKHKQEVSRLFQTAVHKGPVFFPVFTFLDYLRNPNVVDPLIGFNMVAMFITPERMGAFYLCHVCEEQFSTGDVVLHMCSVEHCSRYLAYTNPELLQFAWLNDSFYLQSCATKEFNINGSGNLQVFELPKTMLKYCKKLTYHQVMSVFSPLGKLMELVQASIPKGKSIEEYIADPARAYPLLGLNLLLEYSCPKNERRCGYLCVLCKKKLSATQSISHCISFSHVYCYLNAAHQVLLDTPKSSYSHRSHSFHKKIRYLANEAQIACPPAEIQSVHVDLEGFEVVNASCYASALEKLQAIRRERNQSELNVSVTPGKKLVCVPDDHESSASSAKSQEKETQMEAPVTQTRNDSPCNILCVVCDQMFKYIIDYKKHVKGSQHKQKLNELFGPGEYSGPIPQIKLYQYIWSHQGKTFPPLIGLPLLTAFVQRPSLEFNAPFYLCHACELNIPVSFVDKHLASTQHYLNVFSYFKPDLVFLGSQNLEQLAQEEEQSQEKPKVLKVCELPRHQFTDLRTLAYEKIMETIVRSSTKLGKCVQVEKRVTLQSYSKSCERKSPLLGLQFMVKYTTSGHYCRCSYLCLLCEKKLPERQVIAHVLSRTHVLTYLDVAHPGSLNKDDSEQVSLIMDLAQQAEKITPNMTLREVDVSLVKYNEIGKNSFVSAVEVLQMIFKDKGLGKLEPSVVPGARLVATNKENNSSVNEKQGLESLDIEKLADDGTHSDAPSAKREVCVNAEYPDILHVENEEQLKNPCTASTRTKAPEPSLAAKQSDSTSSQPPIPSIHKEQNEPLKLSLNEGLPDHNCTEDVQAVKHQPQDLVVPQQQSAESAQKPAMQVEVLQVQSPAYLRSKALAVPQTRLSTCIELSDYLKMPNRHRIIGLTSVIECCSIGKQPFYVCITCAERCKKSSVIKHLVSHKHRLQYLESLGIVCHPGKRKLTAKWLRGQAEMVESMHGCGETETLNLNAEDYHIISSADIITALGKLRESLLKLTSEISAQSPNSSCSDNIKTDEGHGPETFQRSREENDTACAVKTTVFDAEHEPPKEKPQDIKSIEPKPAKQQKKKKSNKRNAVIGLNFVTCVHHGKKKLFFCELCSVRGHLDHMFTVTHRRTYVEQKYPGWTPSGSEIEKKLDKIALRLAVVERSTGMGMKKLNVTAKVFTALRTAPLSEALSQLKLLQTNPEDVTFLKTPSSQLELSTFSEHESDLHAPPHHSSPSSPQPSLDRIPPPLSSQSESPDQCAFVPRYLYEPKAPPSASDIQDGSSGTPLHSYFAPPVYEPISPPSSSASQDITSVDPPCSATTQTIVNLTHCMAFKEPADVCIQSIIREESKPLLDTALSKAYSFPNLPTVLEQSNASIFLSVKGLSPIIGLSNILECQGLLKPTFFLCLNCAERVSRENLCDHVTSERHQHLSIKTQYHEIFQQWKNISQMTIHDWAKKLAMAEKGLDAKVIKLNQQQYESLCSADFLEAIEILQRMFGPCLDKSSQQSHLAGQNQRNKVPEISTVRSQTESVEVEQDKDHLLQQSCDKPQIQELHINQVPLKEFDSAQENNGGNTIQCTSALPKSESQTLQHQTVVQMDTSDSRIPLFHSPKPIIKRAKENPVVESLESASEGLKERSLTPTFPCTTLIKQEKTGHDEGNSCKHTDLVYVNKNRTGADSVVGLSGVIECKSEGQTSLYLCVSCSSKLNHDVINCHLIKSGHRYNYLKRRYPSLFEDWSESDSRSERSMRLMRLANEVEMTNEDEPGQLQVIKLKYYDLKQIKAMSYDKAIIHLKKIRKEQNRGALKICISPKITKISQVPRRAFKHSAVEQDLPHLSFKKRRKAQCSDVPSSNMKQIPAEKNNQEPSNTSVKQHKISGNEVGTVAQHQKESVVLTTAKSSRSSHCTPATVPETSRGSSRSLESIPQTYKRTTSKVETVLKNNEKQKSPSSTITFQQMDPCTNTSTISALSSMKSQEITRLSEKRPLSKFSLSENAWNYENRQFSSEPSSMIKSDPVADSYTEAVAKKQLCIAYSVHNYNDPLDPHYNLEVPVTSMDSYSNLNSPVLSRYGYPSAIAVCNAVTSEYFLPVDERAMNYEASTPDISTNGTYFTSRNSVHKSHTSYQPQQVWQPVQSLHVPENYCASACYSYNQALHTNQMAANTKNVTSTSPIQPSVYPLAGHK